MEQSKEKPKTAEELSANALMYGIDFTLDDLAANQEGVLSDNQKANLIRRRANASMLAFTVGAIAFCIVGVFLPYDLTRQEVGPGAVITFFAALALIWFLVSWYRLARDIKMQHIIGVQGRIRLDVANKDYTLQIGELCLNVNKDVFLAFKNGDPYAIYYAPHSKTLLSAEWLGRREVSD